MKSRNKTGWNGTSRRPGHESSVNVMVKGDWQACPRGPPCYQRGCLEAKRGQGEERGGSEPLVKTLFFVGLQREDWERLPALGAFRLFLGRFLSVGVDRGWTSEGSPPQPVEPSRIPVPMCGTFPHDTAPGKKTEGGTGTQDSVPQPGGAIPHAEEVGVAILPVLLHHLHALGEAASWIHFVSPGHHSPSPNPAPKPPRGWSQRG